MINNNSIIIILLLYDDRNIQYWKDLYQERTFNQRKLIIRQKKTLDILYFETIIDSIVNRT